MGSPWAEGPGARGFLLLRVFSDRLVDSTDMETFVALLSEKLGTFFDVTFHHLCPNKRSPIFGRCQLLSGTQARKEDCFGAKPSLPFVFG